MTTKEYLMQIKDIDKKIASLNRSIEGYQSRAMSTAASYSSVPPQHNWEVSQKVAGNVEKIVDFGEEVKRLKSESEQLKVKIGHEISALDNNVFSALLWDYYVNGLPWENVAENLDKDIDYTKKELHNKALRMFEKKFFEKPTNTHEYPFYSPRKVL